MVFIIALGVGSFIGFLSCALFASHRVAKLEARLWAADEIIGLTINAIAALGLWDDKEFAELSKALDKYEEEK
jgi:hypothetical protein